MAGAYCKPEHVRAFNDKLPNSTTWGDQQIQTLVSIYGERIINSRLAGHYDVPFVEGSIPREVETLTAMFTCAVALDGIFGRVGPGSKSTQASGLAKDAEDWIKRIITGKDELHLEDGSVIERTGGGAALFTPLGQERHSESIFVGEPHDWILPDETRAD